jgi:hypothetical protein
MRGALRVLSLLSAVLLVSCSTTDADRIATFVHDVTGEVSRARVEHALSNYVDLAQQSLVLTAFGETKVYTAEDSGELAQRAERKLAFLYGKTLSVLRRKVVLQDGEALVDLSLFSREGAGTVRYTLVKRRDRWLISELALVR